MGAPWFPFYPRDFLAATLGWTAEERGHYLVLLSAQWEQDGLPDDLARLELISPGVRSCWAALADKFPLSRGGRRRNPRLEHERIKSTERSERARQSASARWGSAGATAEKHGENADSPEECDGICDRISDGICVDECQPDASIAIDYSPPPPPSPPPAEPVGWEDLRAAWNAAWNEKRQWRSSQPPPEAIAALRAPGWLADALQAIPAIKAGACSGFDTPPTLRQFCRIDDQGVSFVSRILGGEFNDQSLKRRRAAADARRDRQEATR